MALIAYFDGGCHGNPGPSGYGVYIVDGASGAVVAAFSGGIGVATNNVAEYRGLMAVLQWAVDRRIDEALVVRGDSKLVIEQMAGRWRTKLPHLMLLKREALALLAQLPASVTFQHVPREQNEQADYLAGLGVRLGAPNVRAK